jgi:hypothetical protein
MFFARFSYSRLLNRCDIQFYIIMVNKAAEFSAVEIAFTALSFIFICLRCFVRFKFSKLAYDDLFAVLSFVSQTPIISGYSVKMNIAL